MPATDRSPCAVRRRRRLMRGLLTAGTGVVLLVGGLTLWSGPRHQVPLPGPDATPAEVLTAYLDAVDARDFDTANAIDARPGSDLGRFSRPMTTREVRIEDESVDGDIASVQITADFDGDESMTDGPWGYRLERGDDGRWRITDAGLG